MWKSLGYVTIDAAGTVHRATENQTDPAARLFCHAIMFQQTPGNTGRLAIGDESAHAVTFSSTSLNVAVLEVPTANDVPVATASIPMAQNGLDASQYYIDAEVNGDQCLVSVLIL